METTFLRVFNQSWKKTLLITQWAYLQVVQESLDLMLKLGWVRFRIIYVDELKRLFNFDQQHLYKLKRLFNFDHQHLYSWRRPQTVRHSCNSLLSLSLFSLSFTLSSSSTSTSSSSTASSLSPSYSSRSSSSSSSQCFPRQREGSWWKYCHRVNFLQWTWKENRWNCL